MISVLVLGFEAATGRPATLGESVRTLSALVSGAVDGVIRDVTLLATGSATDLSKVADYAGCGFVARPGAAEALAAGVAQVRSDHVLVLLAGVSFDRALSDEMAVLVSRAAAFPAGGFSMRAAENGWLGRMMPIFATTVGLLTTRERLGKARAASFAGLLRTLRPRGALKTRAWSGAV